jgi:hypothetical protein
MQNPQLQINFKRIKLDPERTHHSYNTSYINFILFSLFMAILFLCVRIFSHIFNIKLKQKK